MKTFTIAGVAMMLISAFALVSGYAQDGQETEVLKPSGTLPVVYIETEGNAPIVSKGEYLQATIYIDPMGDENVAGLGSEQEPVALQIRGRGNASWGFDKKPYRLKLESKASPFGWEKSKHYVLLAHAPTQMYFCEAVCFELARYIDMGWVPRFHPVEVVLNGDYVGVYAFGENVRIDKGRLDINEQPDENTGLSTIDDGWLVEIDNTIDEPQIEVPQGYGASDDAPIARFTMKRPEVLSPLQYDWIEYQMKTITDAIYNPDKNSTDWQQLIDIESLAKYYIIQELTCNLDAFVGSTYIHHTAGGKWTFGPMWDSGWALVNNDRSAGTFCDTRIEIEGHEKQNYVWIKELLKFYDFRVKILEEWEKFYPEKFNQIYDFAENFYNKCAKAYEVNGKRWPQYDSLKFDIYYDSVKAKMPNYSEWMDKYVRDAVAGINDVTADLRYTLDADGTLRFFGGADESVIVYNLQGLTVASAAGDASITLPSRGIYLLMLTGTDGSKVTRKIAW